MDENTRRKIYAALAAPFPEEAIERTKGSVTGKGYDTAGVRAQFLINRLNEVLGLGCYRIHRTINVRTITTPKGRSMYEAVCDMTVELGEWVDGKFVVFAESVSDGGHLATSEIDAKKGSHTGALKRALAGFGIGKAAWEGRLDDDNVPADGEFSPITVTRVLAQPQTVAEATPQGFVRTPTAAEVRSQMPERNRLSSKQLAAIWSIARKLSVEQSSFRSQVKSRFGCQLEFLSRQQASEVITQLNAQLHNGGEHHEQQPEGAA